MFVYFLTTIITHFWNFVLNLNTQLRFKSIVHGPLHPVRQTWQCPCIFEVPEAMYHEERFKAIEGRRVSDRKEVIAGKVRKKTMS